MKKNCDVCAKNEAEFIIKKIPPGKEEIAVELYLCGKCASDYIKHDTVSIVKIAKTQDP